MTPLAPEPPVLSLRSALRWLIFLGCAVAALYWGVTNFWVAVHERQPVEITCADYARARPSSHWLRLTGCVLDVDHMAVAKSHEERAGVATSGDKITAVYLPLRSSEASQGPAQLVLKSTDPDVLFLASQSEDSSTAREAAGRVREWQTHPFEGLLHFGLSVSGKEEKELAQLGLELAPDYAILEEGAHPYFWFALFAVLAGLMGLGAGAWRVASLVRGRRRATASRG